VKQTGKPPKKLTYKGKAYFRDTENAGFYRNVKDSFDDAIEFMSWDYYDEAEELNLCIEQWGKNEFEASFGKLAEEFQFTNIIPANI
jgi:hypothetical protein